MKHAVGGRNVPDEVPMDESPHEAMPPVPTVSAGPFQAAAVAARQNVAQPFGEPDWKRIPGFRGVTHSDWNNATWQRKRTVKSLRELKDALGILLPETLANSIARDQDERAGMSILLPPHVLNTMAVDDLWDDPVRRYMLPAYEDRLVDGALHPEASSDSLHEQDMWAVEGLTHRYPNKVLVELIATCPQYCGHCTRMHLVGKDVPQATKVKFALPPRERQRLMLEYLSATPRVRDVVVSGGDIANVPLGQLESFVNALLRIPTIRDIRLASKALVALPQHYLQVDVLAAFRRLARSARERNVSLGFHTHANHINQITPLVGAASSNLLDAGFRDIRNQGVLLDKVNATAPDILELCLGLLDRTKIMPYYFFMCDMIPNSEHWRLSLSQAQGIQYDLMGLLPGYATPRIVCDVPYLGKRWVHQVAQYDRVRGISYWSPGSLEAAGSVGGVPRAYVYFDPIRSLPPEGREWWRSRDACADPSRLDVPA